VKCNNWRNENFQIGGRKQQRWNNHIGWEIFIPQNTDNHFKLTLMVNDTWVCPSFEETVATPGEETATEEEEDSLFSEEVEASGTTGVEFLGETPVMHKNVLKHMEYIGDKKVKNIH
jgi:hypothetical protein